MIKLGDKVRDTITGFTGVVVGITNWLNGCTRYGIQHEKLKDGKPLDIEWFDDSQVVSVKSRNVRMRITTEPIGGPMPDPKR